MDYFSSLFGPPSPIDDEEQDPLTAAAGNVLAPPPPPTVPAPAALAGPDLAAAYDIFAPPKAAPPPTAAPLDAPAPQVDKPARARFVPELPPDPPDPAAAVAASAKRKDPTRAEVRAESDQGLALQEEGINRGAEAKSARADYLARQRLAALQDEDDAAELIGKAREDVQNHARERMAKVDMEIDSLSKEKPDPRGYWKDQGTLANIATLIGVVLGGYSAARTGKNVPLEMLQREIDRHTDAQAREYAQRLEALKERKGAAREGMAMELDAIEFKVARQVDANNRVMKMIDTAASKYDSEEVQAQRSMAIGELRAKNALLLEDLRASKVKEGQDYARINIAKRAQSLDEQRFEEDKKRWDVEQLMKLQDAQLKGDEVGAKKIADDRAKAVFVDDPNNPGQPIIAGTKEVAEKLNSQRAAGEYLYTSIGRTLDQIGDDDFKAAPLSEQKRRVVAVIGDLENAWSALNEQGVITASDAERYRKLFGQPNDLISNVEQLRQVRGLVVDKVNANLRERTGVKNVTWRADADPEYSTTVRPKSWKSDRVNLPAVPAASGLSRSGGKQLTREEYQQARTRGRLAPDEEMPRTPVFKPGGPKLAPRGDDDDDEKDPLVAAARIFGGR